MINTAVKDLINQVDHTFYILLKEIELFDALHWKTGLDFFLTPVKLAMHIFDCLDYYFCNKPPEDYQWGYRFGGGWWELDPEQQPTQAEMLAYGRELKVRIITELNNLNDDDLLHPWTLDPTAGTYLGHFIYALRHTVHHHGELAALAIYHGKEGGSWE